MFLFHPPLPLWGKIPVEVSAESCPLHLGTALCVCGCVAWTESRLSQSGTSNPKIYELLEKRVTENCGLNFGVSLCFLSLNVHNLNDWQPEF